MDTMVMIIGSDNRKPYLGACDDGSPQDFQVYTLLILAGAVHICKEYSQQKKSEILTKLF